MARAKMDMFLCQAIADFQTRFSSLENTMRADIKS